jgi:hypothetical protein
VEARAKLYFSGGCSNHSTLVYRSGFLVFMRDVRVLNMFGRALTVVTLMAAIALSLLAQSTTPSTVGPIGLLAVFFLLYIIFVGILTWIIHWITSAIVYITRPVVLKRPLQALTISQSYYYASVIALAPIMLLAMKSVSQLGVYEFILIAIFVGIGVFYIRKRLQ